MRVLYSPQYKATSTAGLAAFAPVFHPLGRYILWNFRLFIDTWKSFKIKSKYLRKTCTKIGFLYYNDIPHENVQYEWNTITIIILTITIIIVIIIISDFFQFM